MIATLERIQQLVRERNVRISDHGYEEAILDDIPIRVIVEGVEAAVVVEEYPSYPKGPSVLVLQRCATGQPIHVVWGIPRDRVGPAVLVTAYRPDPLRWTPSFLERR